MTHWNIFLKFRQNFGDLEFAILDKKELVLEYIEKNITEGKYKEGEIYFAPELKSSQLLMLRRIASEKESVFLYSHGRKK